MQYSFVAAALSAAVVYAQEPEMVTNAPDVLASLQSVLPTDVVSQATDDYAGLVASIQSDIEAGNTPTWYSNLPEQIRTLGASELSTIASAASEATDMPMMTDMPANISSVVESVTSAVAGNMTAIGGGSNITMTSTNMSNVTVSTTTGGSMTGTDSEETGGSGGGSGDSNSDSDSDSDSASESESASQSDGGAAMPTAAVGGGIAGAIGVLGLLAL